MSTAISRNIKRMVDERGQSLTDFAFDARVAYSRLHSIVSGKTPSPRIDTLSKIATALDVTVDDLIRDTGERESS